MSAWRDAGEYEVKHGERWQVGAHTLQCADVVRDPRLVADLLQLHPPDVFYCDPPWSDAQARTFRTLAGLPQVNYDFRAIYRAVLWHVAEHDDADVWLVADRNYARELGYELRALRGGRIERWTMRGFSSPSTLAYLFGSVRELDPVPDLTDIKDKNIVSAILREYALQGRSTGTVADLCAGLGITSRAASRAGWRSLSNEVSPPRMSAAIRRLEKLTGLEPERW